MKKVYSWLAIVGITIIAFLCICWVASLRDVANTSWSESMWAFAVTYYLLTKNKEESYKYVFSAAIIGMAIIPLVVILSCWPDGMHSLIFIVASILGIILSGICHYKKSILVFLMSVVILILFNSFAVKAWFVG